MTLVKIGFFSLGVQHAIAQGRESHVVSWRALMQLARIPASRLSASSPVEKMMKELPVAVVPGMIRGLPLVHDGA
jgi:hypothetical protein